MQIDWSSIEQGMRNRWVSYLSRFLDLAVQDKSSHKIPSENPTTGKLSSGNGMSQRASQKARGGGQAADPVAVNQMAESERSGDGEQKSKNSFLTGSLGRG